MKSWSYVAIGTSDLDWQTVGRRRQNAIKWCHRLPCARGHGVIARYYPFASRCAPYVSTHSITKWMYLLFQISYKYYCLPHFETTKARCLMWFMTIRISKLKPWTIRCSIIDYLQESFIDSMITQLFMNF